GHWRNGGNADDGNAPEGHDGEQEVGHRAGRDTGGALFDALAAAGLIQLARSDRRLALVEPLDAATQGSAGNHEFGAAPVMPAVQRRTEADGEAQHLDTTAPGDPEVPVFVDGDQQTEGYHGGQQGKE